MSWICVVGMNVVVDVENRYGELVDVCMPRPRRTSRDSSVGRLVNRHKSSVKKSGSRTGRAASHAKVQDSETQDGNDPPIQQSGNDSCSIFEEAKVDECMPWTGSKLNFCCRNVDEEYADADQDSQSPLEI